MQNVGTGIVITSYYVMGGEHEATPEPTSQRTPILRNIGISSVIASHAEQAIDIQGLPEMPISALRLDDVVASGKKGLFAKYTSGLELHHVTVNAEDGSPFTIGTATNLLLDHITTNTPLATAPVVTLQNAPGTLLRDSRAFPGTGTFVSAPEADLRSLHLIGNELSSAKQATALASQN